MKVIDSDKNGAALIGKVLGTIFFVPWVVMLAAGTLAHHHEFLRVLHQFTYWDWILINIVLSLFRNKGVSKWYFKEEK